MLIYVFIILYGREKCKVVNCNLAEHCGVSLWNMRNVFLRIVLASALENVSRLW